MSRKKREATVAEVVETCKRICQLYHWTFSFVEYLPERDGLYSGMFIANEHIRHISFYLPEEPISETVLSCIVANAYLCASEDNVLV